MGAGPAGLACALLLARAGRKVELFEGADKLGGLWSTARDEQGFYLSENSCKVFQASYHSAPALFELLGTRWQDHFVPRHDLGRDWLRPFVRDSRVGDLAKLAAAYAAFRLGDRRLRDVSVGEWMERRRVSAGCRDWMRATALGGVAGTLRMTMWELCHRLRGNVLSVIKGGGGQLYWNRQPPDAPGGFLEHWARGLSQHGVRLRLGTRVDGVERQGGGVRLRTPSGTLPNYDAAFLAVPPRGLAALLAASEPAVAEGLAVNGTSVSTTLGESLYEHLGVTWHFDQPLPRDLPLGGHNVRRHWHAILVQHDQYRPLLRAPTSSVVVGSVSLDTDFRHPRLGSRAADHDPAELARIVWDDERSVDPSLPEPSRVVVHGLSDATQVVRHGPLRVQSRHGPVFVATSINGAAPYFTASLESAIQAGAAAARAFDPSVLRLPTGPGPQVPWS